MSKPIAENLSVGKGRNSLESQADIRLGEGVDFRRWNEYLLNSPQAHFLQSIHMVKVFQQISFRPFLVLAEREGSIVGGLISYAWFGDSKFPLAKLFSRLYSYYGPILSSSEIHTSLLEKLLRFVYQINEKNFIMDHQISFIPQMGAHNILETMKYSETASLRYTFVLDLRESRQKLWESLEKRCRSAIRRAENEGLRIVHESSIEAPKIFHWLHLVTAKRLGIHPDPYSFIEAIWKNLVPSGHAKFYFVYHKDHPIAGAIITNFKKKLYYYMSASLKEYRNLYPNNFLQWQIIQDGKNGGYEFYDFMGSPGKEQKEHPEYGLYLFKRSFGGEMVQIGPSYSKVFSPYAARFWESFLVPTFKRVSFISKSL